MKALTPSRFLLAAFALLLLASAPVSLAVPLGTGFTYQGNLEENGAAPTGLYDFRVFLYDALTAGALVAGPVFLDDVEVREGLFAMEIDFGANPFNGDAMWLEIHVGPGDGSSVPTPLLPRQALTAAPYAFYALNGGSGGTGLWTLNGTAITNNNTGNVGVGVGNPLRKLAVDGDGEYTKELRVVDAFEVFPDAAWDKPAVRLSSGPVADTSTHGEIQVWNGVEYDTFFVTGNENNDQGASLSMHSGRFQTVEIDANVNGGAYMDLRTATGEETIVLDADDGNGDGYIRLDHGVSKRIELDAREAGGGASAVLRNDTAIGTIYLDAQSSNNGGEIQVKGQFGNVGVQIVGDWANGKGRVITDVLQINGGADLSEQFDVAFEGPELEPGTVVSIDPQNPGKLLVTGRAYDRRVAGIVSGAGGVAPGMLMGHEGTIAAGEHPIALTGRVYCKVDASNGAIEPGDLLTSSDRPGFAMKATDAMRSHGAIIGKAMTGLSDGTGLVLVLVSLQ